MRQFRPARMSVLKSSGTCFLHKVALLHPLVSSTTRLSFQARPFLFPSSSSLSSSFAENKLNYVGMNMSKSMSTNAHKHDEGSPPGHSINNGDIRGTESGLNKNNKTSIMFTLPDSPGALQTALGMFTERNVNLARLESRPSKKTTDYEMYVDFEGQPSDPHIEELLSVLRGHSRDLHILNSKKVAWFPQRLKDVDLIASQVLGAGEDLESDHPGFSDPEYRARRQELAQIALDFTLGEKIPYIEYTKSEIETWRTVYNRIFPLYEQHACKEFNRLLPLFEENCGYSQDSIPQVSDISEFLQECTGFQLRPVAGLLSARNFLYGLAFRVFFSTQYIRHHSKPLYTPEPDICHELLGHAPLFADKDFADFSQQIGLASLGATDEQITKLARCYWFTVEFGLCGQEELVETINGEMEKTIVPKAFGAGLLSSFGELEYAMSGEPEIRPWNPYDAGEQDYPITTYQPIYYMAESFADAKDKMVDFSNSFARPFNVRYNPYTRQIEVDANVDVGEKTADL